ncbi:MAG: hypothetical protein HOP19_26020, partial [Acidobacteria bacterium]|nr:hypothetical protein [Acidobacteriota bacterium]
ALSGNDLYAGGTFTTAGGVSAINIAKWNGTSWSALGVGVGGGNWVSALAINGSDLYVGGFFTTAGGKPASNIAKWNGTSWSALGSGVVSNRSFGGTPINGMAVGGGDLYVGGNFTIAGNKPSNAFGRYRISDGTPPTIAAAAALQRQQGSLGTISTIASVSDAETASGSLTVAATTVPAGIKISNITNTNGRITAMMAAECNATVGANTVVLRVSDGALTATANLTVNVSAIAPLGLSYAPVVVSFRQNAVANPSVPLSDNFRVTDVIIRPTGKAQFSGAYTFNQANGVITITDASVPGLYTVAVRVENQCGKVSEVTFPLNVVGALVISEIGFHGPRPYDDVLDWYVELFNNSEVPISTAGLILGRVYNSVNRIHSIGLSPNHVIPARGTYLIAGQGFSLGVSATQPNGVIPDQQLTGFSEYLNFPTAAFALFKGVLAEGNRIDGAGLGSGIGSPDFPAYFYEGPTFLPGSDYVVRKFAANDLLQDTQNNQADFMSGVPGPQNSLLPPLRNHLTPLTLFAPLVSANAAPNFERNVTAVNGPQGNYPLGTFTLRRTITNKTGAPIRRLRLRITDISDGSLVGQANIRLLDSVDATINGLPVKGVTVDTLTAQPQGGGFNSTLNVGAVTSSQPIPVGGTINLQFRLGIVRGGSYRFFFNVEAVN